MADFIFNSKGLEKDEQEEYEFNEDDLQDDPVKFSSQLGTPVMSNLSLKAGSYPLNGRTVNFQGIDLDSVLMTINQTKNIVTTAVQGRAGTVKEYISKGDYTINVKGFLVSEDNDSYPADQVRILNEILNAPISLDFTSNFLDRFGSFDLTVTSFDFNQEAGFINRQAFNINFLSDNPIELQLNAEADL